MLNESVLGGFRFAPDIIFDVGMHDGKDTAFYLHRGYKVVAVEANPKMCERAAERFKEALKKRQLHIENVAIHENDEVRPFYISEVDKWCSFDLGMASREHHSYKSVPMQCTSLSTLLQKYGVPYYLKIDIEGADSYCLKSLCAECLPRYVSLECGKDFGSDVHRLHELGYEKFKLIDQENLRSHPHHLKESLVQQLRYRAKRKLKNVSAGRWRDEWMFEGGSSGPFGDEADGPWLSVGSVLGRKASWQRSFEHLGLDPNTFWQDLHAAR